MPMGLDGVEIVMELEDEFKVTLPDAKCSCTHTVMDVAAMVISELRLRTTNVCPTAHQFYKLRNTLVDVLHIDKQSIRPRTMLSEIFPADDYRRIWEQLRIKIPNLPAPEIPHDASKLGAWIFMLGIVTIAVMTGYMFWLLNFTHAVSMGFFMLFAWVLLSISFTLFRSTYFGTHIPAVCTTFGDLVRTSMPTTIPFEHSERLAAEYSVIEKVRAIIAEQMGLPLDDVTPEKRLVKDLQID